MSVRFEYGCSLIFTGRKHCKVDCVLLASVKACFRKKKKMQKKKCSWMSFQRRNDDDITKRNEFNFATCLDGFSHWRVDCVSADDDRHAVFLHTWWQRTVRKQQRNAPNKARADSMGLFLSNSTQQGSLCLLSILLSIYPSTLCPLQRNWAKTRPYLLVIGHCFPLLSPWAA